MIYLEKPQDFNPKFEIVSCFLEWQGTFLLLHRQDTKPQGNTWGMPAGKVEAGEKLDDAIIRELEEETGYKTTRDNIQLVHTVFVRHKDYDLVYYMYSHPLTQRPEIKVDPTSHKAFQWVTPQEALEKELIHDLADCIKLNYSI